MQSILPRAVRELVHELNHLPGIGPKTAQRLAIHLLRQSPTALNKLADTLKHLHENVHICLICFNLAEQKMCAICKDEMRNKKLLCVVEDPLDIEAIERTGSYDGLYHVLGGVLSPLEGIGTEQLTIGELVKRVNDQDVKELIIALDHNMEAEATVRHITAQLKGVDITVTRLARGLPTGGDIEFADAMTLTAAFDGRKRLETGN